MTSDRPTRPIQDIQLSDRSSPERDAALRGAALAFGKPPVKPKPNLKSNIADDGALAAARGVGGSRLGAGSPSHEPILHNHTGGQARVGRHDTGGSTGVVSPRNGTLKRSPSRPRVGRLDSSGFLQPTSTPGPEGRSPSFIAAALAASRSASVSPNLTGQKASQPEFRSKSSFTRSPSTRRSPPKEAPDSLPDTTSIPVTTSLIGMFEQNAKTKSQRKPPAIRKNSRGVNLASPSIESVVHASPSPSLREQTSSTDASTSPPQHVVAPIPVKPKRRQPVPIIAPDFVPQLKPQTKTPKQALDPQKSPSASMQWSAQPSDIMSISPDDSVISTLDYRPSPPPPRKNTTPKQRRLTASSAVSQDQVDTTEKINAMANAIVASSLASSRAASPSKQHLQPPPPPPSRRSPRGIDHLFHSHKEMSRTPSPSKQSTLRTTMRKPRTEPEVDEGDKRRSKKHSIMKKHPNKHHEGDRKRWRDEITERERKRYEAIWASNRGLHVPSSLPGWESCVCNLVVKDIFTRSRLHADVLEEVYTLIDRKQNGALEKEEFVVGLWLIDQRLKGRKLPIRVSDHVWRSVGGLQGIKVRKAH